MDDKGKAVTIKRGTVRKAITYGVGAVVAVIVLGLLILLLPQVRGRILSEALHAVNDRLPGDLTVRGRNWSLPLVLRLGDILWVNGAGASPAASPGVESEELRDAQAETLLVARGIEVSVDPLALLHRDLNVTGLRVDGLSADVPSIIALFAASGPGTGTAEKAGGGRTFPRNGSVRGAPSMAVADLRVTGRSIRVSAGTTLDRVELSGSFDFREGRRAGVRLDALSLEATAGGDVIETPRIERADLTIDVPEGRLQGTAAGALSPGLPFFLNIASEERDSFRMTLSAGEGGRPFEHAGLELTGRLIRSGDRVSAVSYDADLLTPGTLELSSIPALEEPLKGYPQLEGIPAELHGQVTFEPAFAVECRVDMKSNSWLDGGAARVTYSEDVLSVEALTIDLPDLALRAQGRLMPDSVLASAHLVASGTRWLKTLAPNISPPDSLAINLKADVAGPRAAPLIQTSLEASARRGDFTLEQLKVTTVTPSPIAGGPQPPMQATLFVRALGAAAAATAELAPPEAPTRRLKVRLTPVVVHDSGEPSSSQPKRMLQLSRDAVKALGPCAIELRPDEKSLAVDNLRLMGGLGELRFDGDLSAEKAGTFALSWALPTLPSLLAKSIGLTADAADSLRSRWPAQEPPGLALRGTLDPSGPQVALSTAGDISLPGPRTLSPMLPAGMDVADLGPLRGDLQLTARRAGKSTVTRQGQRAAGGGDASFEASLNLGRTGWIDSATVALRGAGSRVTLDSAAVAFEGLSCDLEGEVEGGYWDLRAKLDLADARILRRLRPSLPEDLDVKLDARANFTGRMTDPRLDASFTAALNGPEYAAPRVVGRASWSESGFTARINAPQGFMMGALAMDSVTVSYSAEDTSGALLPGRFTVLAQGERLEISHAASLQRLDRGEASQGSEGGAGWRIATESLAFAIEGNDLASTRPFDLYLRPGDGGIAVEGLSLKGSLGKLAADGYASRTGSNMKLEADLSLPKDPPFIDVSEGLWPESLRLVLATTEEDGLRAGLTAKGLALGDRRDLEARLSVSDAPGADTGVSAQMVVSAGVDTLLNADGRLPLSISVYPPGCSMDEGPVFVNAAARALPIPVTIEEGTVIAEPNRTAALDAKLEVRGTSREPSARLDGRMTFPNWPKMYKYQLNFAADMSSGPSHGGTARGPALTGDDTRIKPQAIPELDGPGVAAAFNLERDGKRPMAGTLELPMTWSLLPPAFKADEVRNMDLRVEADGVELANFDDFLPPKYGLEGKCSFKVAATGPSGNPALGGRLSASDARITIDDGTHVTASAGIDLAGTRANPSLAGRIEIHNGVIVIPEKSRKLLPSEGQAALWELKSMRPGRELTFDSGAGSAAPAKTRRELQTVPEPPKTQLELDVTVDIPSGLWVRGRGLDVGLAGDLRLVQRGALPTISGELDAVQGRFVFLGQTFLVDHGKAVFYGGDEIDPSLDLVLTTSVGGTLIQITLGGSANDPKLQLSSVPELPEGDIMSLLIFGRTMDELDNDQMSLLGSRATDIATAFGTAQLEAKLARQLGVDMVRITSGSEDGGGSSLVIGKYISTRVLLKYEQALAERARFYVNLEYFLTRHFRLETLIGHESQSAVQLNWTKEH